MLLQSMVAMVAAMPKAAEKGAPLGDAEEGPVEEIRGIVLGEGKGWPARRGRAEESSNGVLRGGLLGDARMK